MFTSLTVVQNDSIVPLWTQLECLLSEANIDLKYWPEVIKAATYLKNRTLANTHELKTPYEIFMGKRPDVSNLRLYGSK